MYLIKLAVLWTFSTELCHLITGLKLTEGDSEGFSDAL